MAGAGRGTFVVDGTNFGAAAHAADKYDMPQLGKQVVTYLNMISINTGNERGAVFHLLGR